MVIPTSFDESEHTYENVMNRLFKGDRERFKEVIEHSLDENVVAGCNCECGEGDKVKFDIDKLYIYYCKTCGGVGERSRRGNHF